MDNKINILFLKKSGNMGGAEKALIYLFRHLDTNKFHPFVIFAEKGPLVETIRGFNINTQCFCLLGGIFGFLELPRLTKFIFDNNIHIIHSHGVRVNFWGAIAASIAKIPIVTTDHSIDLWRGKNFIFELLDRFAGYLSSMRVGCSQAVAGMLQTRGNKNVVCIENGIDLEEFNAKKQRIPKLSEFGLQASNIIVGTVGRLTELKGHIYLIKAAKKVLNVLPEARFMIVGGGELMGSLKKLVEEIGISDKVIFTGARNDIPDILSIFDIFILPSLTEGLPLALIEAMASEKPIIASAVSGIPELIDNGINGLLVNPKDVDALADSILYLVNSKENASLFAKKAREKAILKFDSKYMVSRYEALYQKVLSNHNG